MAFHHIDITLAGNTKVSATRIPIKQLVFHNPAGNAAILVGDKNLSATSYGFQVAAGTNSPVIGPFSGELPCNLDEIFIRGTDAQVVHAGYIT